MTRQPPARPVRATADDATRKTVARRLASAKEAGWTRPQLAELAFGDADATYGIWRAQETSRGLYVEHVEPITAALDRIDAGDATPPERAPRVAAGPTKADLTAQLDALNAVLETVRSYADATFTRSKATAAEKKLASGVLGLLGDEQP